MPKLRLRQAVLLIELMTPLLNIVKGTEDSKKQANETMWIIFETYKIARTLTRLECLRVVFSERINLSPLSS